MHACARTPDGTHERCVGRGCNASVSLDRDGQHSQSPGSAR